ncbi:MAG: hypothetical protein K940chlam8_00922 [Chlamydiae bacterium]|nr:hypothetical protein [Chlamydiota bacterium]
MPLTKKKQRELVLQTLFATTCVPLDESFVAFLMDMHKITKKQAHGVETQVSAIQKKQTIIETLIQKSVKGYALKRITKIELCILQLLMYEILEEKLDFAIAVSEGLRLCKKYSNPESMPFVHAILDAIKAYV